MLRLKTHINTYGPLLTYYCTRQTLYLQFELKCRCLRVCTEDSKDGIKVPPTAVKKTKPIECL